MFSTLKTIIQGRSERARDNLENTHATLILEQKIREATNGHDKAKRALATLILRERTDAQTLKMLTSRIKDLETRTREALKGGLDALAEEAAESLADLETEKQTREKALEKTKLSTERLRLMIDKCQRRLMELRQGLITAQSIEQERSSSNTLQGDIAGVAALVEGEAVLQRLMDRPDSVQEMEILDQLNCELSGEDLVERLAAEGIGEPVRTRGQDVLDRLRSQSLSED